MRYLDGLSPDIRASVVLDPSGAEAASSHEAEDGGDRMGDLVRALLRRADVAAGEPVSQVEVSTPAGVVFAVREEGWTVAAVTGRSALASLMFYDLRSVLSDLEKGP